MGLGSHTLCVYTHIYLRVISLSKFPQPFELVPTIPTMWYRLSILLSLVFVAAVQSDNSVLRNDIQLSPSYQSLPYCEKACAAGVQGTYDTHSVAFQSECTTKSCICSLSNLNAIGPMAGDCLVNFLECNQTVYKTGIRDFFTQWCASSATGFGPVSFILCQC